MSKQKSTQSILNSIKRERLGEEESNYCRVGYWLVREYDNQIFYISEYVSEPALEKVCNKALSDKTGYGYWVDYCFGLDVTNKPAWGNMDYTESFI